MGHRVEIIAPVRGASGGLLHRVTYNAALPLRRRLHRADLVVGCDLDGCWYRPTPTQRFVVALKGIIADERRFETGRTRRTLGVLARLERRNARRAETVVVTSEYSRAAAVEAYGLQPHRVAVVPEEGIDVGAWDRLRAGVRDVERPPTVLAVARAYPRKNLATLVAAAPLVRRAVPEARFVVVGGGPELPALRKQVAALPGRPVTLTGELPDPDDVRRAFLHADLFCLPSLQEGFGLVFLEAMAAGLPIVAARAAATPELVSGQVGRLVDRATDPAAVAEAVVAVLGDRRLRAAARTAGPALARRYDWTQVAPQFLTAALGER